MELFKALHGRRTIQHFRAGAQVSNEALDKALEAAHMAPCHKLTWPWRFTTLGPQARARLAQIAVAVKGAKKGLSEDERRVAEAQMLAPGAVVGVSVVRCEQPFQAREDYAAAACAVQNMMLALHAQGLGSKWTTSGFTTHADTYALLGIDPAQEEIIGLVLVGAYDHAPHIPRPPVAQVVRAVP